MEHAGRIYQVAGSFGTSPGFNLGFVHVPLNVDEWFELSLLAANTSVYQNSAGTLDSNGSAQAAIVVPALNDPGLIGLVLYHAYAVFDSTQVVMASKSVNLTLRQ